MNIPIWLVVIFGVCFFIVAAIIIAVAIFAIANKKALAHVSLYDDIWKVGKVRITNEGGVYRLQVYRYIGGNYREYERSPDNVFAWHTVNRYFKREDAAEAAIGAGIEAMNGIIETIKDKAQCSYLGFPIMNDMDLKKLQKRALQEEAKL